MPSSRFWNERNEAGLTAIVARGERTQVLSASALAVGVVASVVLWLDRDRLAQRAAAARHRGRRTRRVRPHRRAPAADPDLRGPGGHPHRRLRRLLEPDPRHRRAGRAHRLARPRCSPSASRSCTAPTASSTSRRATSARCPRSSSILLIAKDAPGGAPDWMTGLPYPVALVIGLISARVPRLRRRAHDHQPVLPGAAPRAHRRDDRRRAAPDRARALHARAGSGSRTVGRPVLNPPFDIKVQIGGVFFDATT